MQIEESPNPTPDDTDIPNMNDRYFYAEQLVGADTTIVWLVDVCYFCKCIVVCDELHTADGSQDLWDSASNIIRNAFIESNAKSAVIDELYCFMFILSS